MNSCDALFGISKQTVNTSMKMVLGEDIKRIKLLKYVPHGLNPNIFKPINQDDI
jgi:hypothetical protein